MTKLTMDQTRQVVGGESVYCKDCHRTFKDVTFTIGFLWWKKTFVLKTGQQSYAQHLYADGSCRYRRK